MFLRCFFQSNVGCCYSTVHLQSLAGLKLGCTYYCSSSLPPTNVTILGGGPAAWTAAMFVRFLLQWLKVFRYTARADLAPLVFEGELSDALIPGGQLMTTTEVEKCAFQLLSS